jgi:hypothetical protein
LTKEAQLPARFLGPNEIPIGRFVITAPLNLIDSPKSFKSLKVRFDSSTMVLTKLVTFLEAVGDAVLAIKVEV